MTINKSFQTTKNKLRKVFNNTEKILIDINSHKFIQNNITRKLKSINLYQNIDNILDFTTEYTDLGIVLNNIINFPQGGSSILFKSWEIDIRGASYVDLVGFNYSFVFKLPSGEEMTTHEGIEIKTIDYISQNSSLELELEKSFTISIGIYLHDQKFLPREIFPLNQDSQNGLQVRLLANLVNPKKYY